MSRSLPLSPLAIALVALLAACGPPPGPADVGATPPAGQRPEPVVTAPADPPSQPLDIDPLHCDGFVAAHQVEQVVVPENRQCTLEGTTVLGNVSVNAGALLHADAISVDGNIQAQGALEVNVTSSTVGGNIQVEQGESSSVADTFIGGDLQWEAQTGSLVADANEIGGNLQANQNSGGLTISGNVIDGNLECQGNDPPPTGGGNEVLGSREDQCADL